MIDIEFGTLHIQKEKGSYALIDKREILGDGNIAFKMVNGETYMQNKRVRDDGYIDTYSILLLCSYDERAILQKMLTGTDKVSKCNSAILSISEENKRTTMVRVVGSNSGFYNEENIIESVDVANSSTHPSQFDYNEEDLLYEIMVMFVVSK